VPPTTLAVRGAVVLSVAIRGSDIRERMTVEVAE
jgi:hypothetical protein